MGTPLRLFFEQTQIGLLARVSYRERVRGRLIHGATQHLPPKPSVAELESQVLEKLRTFAAENHSSLVVGWSDEGESYQWIQSWANQHGIGFADWLPKAKRSPGRNSEAAH